MSAITLCALWRRITQLYLRTLFNLFLAPPSPGGPEGGSGLSFSFRSRGFWPDPVRGDFNFEFHFDLKHSWDHGIHGCSIVLSEDSATQTPSQPTGGSGGGTGWSAPSENRVFGAGSGRAPGGRKPYYTWLHFGREF